MQVPVVSVVHVRCESVYIFWQNVCLVGKLKMQQIDPVKVQRWSFMFWSLLWAPLILQPSFVRGEWRTLSSGEAVFNSAWPILNPATSLMDRGRHFVTLCLVVWKRNSGFCRRWETSGLSRIGCCVFRILLNLHFTVVNLLNESV